MSGGGRGMSQKPTCPVAPLSAPMAGFCGCRVGDTGQRMAQLYGLPVARLPRPHLGLSSASRGATAGVALGPAERPGVCGRARRGSSLAAGGNWGCAPAHLRTRPSARRVRGLAARPGPAPSRGWQSRGGNHTATAGVATGNFFLSLAMRRASPPPAYVRGQGGTRPRGGGPPEARQLARGGLCAFAGG
jgi:hypothetical protein